ncbi:fibrillin-2-like, partial [Dendropsophus ebraccatus]|uniref:fibrillin-2-like n=1 Tax=Dendropsophus ebraccatus TaxID=150705 RepID=UPI0038315E53
HCVSGLAFTRGQYVSQEEEGEENVLSPETCYECKINGSPKKPGRAKRSWSAADSVSNEDVSLKSLDMEEPLKIMFNILELNKKKHILELVPAIQPLTGHVRYVISNGNNTVFHINQKDGLSYLHLAQKDVPPGQYTLDVTSVHLYKKRDFTQLEEQHDDNYLSGELGQTLRMRLQIDISSP